jgi:hypothetical protein
MEGAKRALHRQFVFIRIDEVRVGEVIQARVFESAEPSSAMHNCQSG